MVCDDLTRLLLTLDRSRICLKGGVTHKTNSVSCNDEVLINSMIGIEDLQFYMASKPSNHCGGLVNRRVK